MTKDATVPAAWPRSSPTTSKSPPEHGNVWIQALTADSRAVGAGMLFAALPGTKSDGAQFIPQAVEAGAAAILMGQQPLAGRASDPGHPRRRSAPRAGADGGALLCAPAAHRRRGHRHQRQDLRHRVPAADLGEGRATRRRASARSGSSRRAARSTGNLTTPDPVKLHEIMADLAGDDVTHLALEASSHGLEQRRLDGVRFAAGAFTNLSRDHLDYHRDAARTICRPSSGSSIRCCRRARPPSPTPTSREAAAVQQHRQGRASSNFSASDARARR